eukprot:scaffold87910_cov63-Phaeocystis_antarctica.AAC.2
MLRRAVSGARRGYRTNSSGTAGFQQPGRVHCRRRVPRALPSRGRRERADRARTDVGVLGGDHRAGPAAPLAHHGRGRGGDQAHAHAGAAPPARASTAAAGRPAERGLGGPDACARRACRARRVRRRWPAATGGDAPAEGRAGRGRDGLDARAGHARRQAAPPRPGAAGGRGHQAGRATRVGARLPQAAAARHRRERAARRGGTAARAARA